MLSVFMGGIVKGFCSKRSIKTILRQVLLELLPQYFLTVQGYEFLEKHPSAAENS